MSSDPSCLCARFHAIELHDDQKNQDATPEQKERMHKALIVIWLWALGLFVVLCLAWPLLALPAGKF